MSTLTPNFGLVKPDPADVIVNLNDLNNNATTIDTELQGALSSSVASKTKLINHNNIVVNTNDQVFTPGWSFLKLETVAVTGPLMVEYWFSINTDIETDTLRFWAISTAPFAAVCIQGGPTPGATWNYKSSEIVSDNLVSLDLETPDDFNVYKCRYFCTDAVAGSVTFYLGGLGVGSEQDDVCTLRNYTMRRWAGV